MGKSRDPMGIVACDAGIPLARKVYERIKEKGEPVVLVDSTETWHPDGEIKTTINQSIRGMDIYIIQDFVNSVARGSINDKFAAFNSGVKGVKRSQARNITPVIPYFKDARQSENYGREGILAKGVAKIIEGMSRKIDTVVTFDIHEPAIAGFFDEANLENLHASKQIIEFIESNYDLENLVISSTDEGGVDRANHYAKNLGCDLGIIYKRRSRGGKIEEVTFLGDCKDKDVIFVDDMVDTGGTIVKDTELVLNLKDPFGNDISAETVSFASSLPVYSDPCVERMDKLYSEGKLRCGIRTDTIYHGEDFGKEHSWDRCVSIVNYLAKVLINLNKRESLSELLQ